MQFVSLQDRVVSLLFPHLSTVPISAAHKQVVFLASYGSSGEQCLSKLALGLCHLTKGFLSFF